MAVAVSITKVVFDGQNSRVTGNLTFSGSYPTGGDTIDFTKATQDPAFIGLLAQIVSSVGPVSIDVWSQGGNTAVGYFPILGTTLANSKVKIVTAFNTEASAGAYSSVAASVPADKVTFDAVFASDLL